MIACFLLSLFSYTQAKERVIDRPPFLAWSSSSLEIDKVVLSDTATVLHIKAFYRPKNWIKIASGTFLKVANGEMYPLRRGVGITPDKEFWMPESGEAEFQLVFPPLPPNTTSFDFSEGDFEGSFQIWGIQLKKMPKLALPQEFTAKQEKLAALPTPKVLNGKARLTGKVLDFAPGMMPEIPLYLSGCINLSQNEKIKVNNDGTFSAEIPAVTVTPAFIYLNGKMLNLYLAPGEETKLAINLRELARAESKLHKNDKPEGEPIYYGGYLAGLSQEVASQKFAPNMDADFEQLMKAINGKDAEAFKAYLMEQRQEKLATIKELKASEACKQLFRYQLDASVASLLEMSEPFIQRAYVINNHLNDQQEEEYMKNNPVKLPEDYFNVLAEFTSLNEPEAVYAQLFNRLSNTPSFLKHYAKAMNTDKGNLFEIASVGRVLYGILDFIPATEQQLTQLAELHPVYAEAIKPLNDKLLKTIEANKKKTGFTINEAGEVSNEDLFASIISKFRGKVILVDFWATWCGPCRMANKTMLPMKEELKDKEIVYLYLTGETSPLETWQNMIADIHGEHFRVTDAQWKYFSDELKIQGVPTYILVDREGNTVYRTTGFPGNETMKAELLKAIDKK